MGDVIRKTAAADDIIADVQKTLVNARAKGGVVKELAEERLLPVVHVLDKVAARLTDATKAATPLVALVNAHDDAADRFLGRLSDDVYNDVGRPGAGTDPALAVLFPGGASAYTDGPDEEQPDRMELLAELLEAGVHPKLSSKLAHERAKEVRKEAAAYRAVLDQARLPRARVRLLEKVRVSVARSGHTELANLKRAYKSKSLTEAQVHEVIPDRPRPSAPAAPVVSPVPATPPASPPR